MDQIALNERTVTISMKRIDLCDLLLACTNSMVNSQRSDGRSAAKWKKLHDRLKETLDEFDREQGF